MKLKLSQFLINFIFINVINAQYIEFEKFQKKYSAPQDLKELIEKNADSIVLNGYVHLMIPLGNPSKYITKGGYGALDRLINAERMRNYLRNHNLTCIEVPHKYFCQVNNKLVVFARFIEQDQKPSKLTLQEIQQLTTLAEETGYTDWHAGNIIRATNGKLVIIDTENDSFRPTILGYPSRKLDYTYRITRLHGAMTPQALEWCAKRIEYLKSNPEGMSLIIPMKDNTQWDDPNINIPKAIDELSEMIKNKFNPFANQNDRDVLKSKL